MFCAVLMAAYLELGGDFWYFVNFCSFPKQAKLLPVKIYKEYYAKLFNFTSPFDFDKHFPTVPLKFNPTVFFLFGQFNVRQISFTLCPSSWSHCRRILQTAPYHYLKPF